MEEFGKLIIFRRVFRKKGFFLYAFCLISSLSTVESDKFKITGLI